MSKCKKCKRLVVDHLWTTEQYIARNHWRKDDDLDRKRKEHRDFLKQEHPKMVECARCDRMVEWA
jgi:hypothetical protein